MSTKQFAYYSAAMKAGIEMFPAAHGPYVKRVALDDEWHVCGSCAIGAGMVAMELGESCTDVYAAFPYMKTRAGCPEDGCTENIKLSSLLDVAITLFEEHDWTREAVTDWLYAEEEKLGFVTISDETEALKSQVGFINNVTEAQAGVLTK